MTAGAPSREPPDFWRALQGLRQRGDYDELLDLPENDPATLAGNLRDLRLMNRWLGWSAGVWQDVRRVLPPGCTEATLLDVATGSADVPRSLAVRARARGVRLHLIGSDVNAQVLANARAGMYSPEPPVAFVLHDATALPFVDHAVDISTLCLAAHHLDAEQLAAVLAELWRVSRYGVVVSDLERGRLAYIGARLMALVLRNRLTAHDGPVSVLRAYTAPELRAIARRAGLHSARIVRRTPFRMSLVARKQGPSSDMAGFHVAPRPVR